MPFGPRSIYPQQNEQQNSKSPQRRPPITEKRQRYTDNRAQSYNHTDIHRQMKKQYRDHTISIYPSKSRMLPFSDSYKSEYERDEKNNHTHSSPKALLLTNGTKDKVGILLRHIFQFRLSPIQKTFSQKAPRTDGDFRLVHIISRPNR